MKYEEDFFCSTLLKWYMVCSSMRHVVVQFGYLSLPMQGRLHRTIVPSSYISYFKFYCPSTLLKSLFYFLKAKRRRRWRRGREAWRFSLVSPDSLSLSLMLPSVHTNALTLHIPCCSLNDHPKHFRTFQAERQECPVFSCTILASLFCFHSTN